MNIAATIHAAETLDNGSVRIYLRPIAEGEIAGQRSLTITNWPKGKSPYGLVGTDIWGGSGQIMIGERVWAERRGYTHIFLTSRHNKGAVE